MSWQPIETAPKNHGAYLFLCGRVVLEGFLDVTDTYCVRQEAGQGWRKMWRKPTHWMPLPPPPSSDAAPQAAPAVDEQSIQAARWRLVENAPVNVTLRLHNLRPDQRAQYIDAALAAQESKS